MTSEQRLWSEEGFASAVVLAMLVLVSVCCLAVADAANVLLAGLRARTAADAAVLAAATEQWGFLGVGADPPASAERAAAANGAALVTCDCPPRAPQAVVTVSVPTRARILHVVPRVHATSRAGVDPARLFAEP